MTQQRGPDGKFLPSDKAPAGWEPYTEIGKDDAHGVVAGEATEAQLLQARGWSPLEWEITNLRYKEYKGEVSTQWSARKRKTPLRELLDPAELLAAVETWGTPKPPKLPKGDDAFVVCLADWQVGGTGPGGGSRETIDRVLAMGGAVCQRVAELRESGRAIPELVVIGLGDLVEGCTGFYPNQPFTVDLDNRSQIRTTYHLLTALFRMWAPLFDFVTVAPIGGNHGETRSAFKNETGPADNKDVLAFEIVRDVLAEHPGYAHFSWHIPEGELAGVVEAAGVKLGYTHGHMFSGGQNASAKAERWWKGQAFGLQPVKDAQILYSGHFHHLSITEFSDAGRTWFQTPACDNGSEWFTNFSGMSSAPGTLTMRVGKGCGPRLWDDMAVL